MIGQNIERSKQELRDMQMILRIQYVLLLVLLVVSFAFVFLSGKVLFIESQLISLRMNILNVGLLILVSVIAFFMRRSTLQQIKNQHEITFLEVKKYRNMYFIQAALFESVCIFSMLIYVFWGHEYSLILGFIMVLVLKLTFPANEKVKRELQLGFDL